MAEYDISQIVTPSGDICNLKDNISPRVNTFVTTITTNQWIADTNDYYITINSNKITENSILIPSFDHDSEALLTAPVWCEATNGSFKIHTNDLPLGTVTILVQIPGIIGDITYQILANNVITGVKGDAESSYRTGNVNLTAANIGAKATQSAVSDPTASGTGLTFIDSITQDVQGVITPTKKTVRSASQSESGLMSATDKTKLDGIASGAQVNTITGVKGDAESNYRTGNVNLTAANTGAVTKSGDTMTGNLYITRSAETFVKVTNSNTNASAYLDSDGNGYHGVWSSGYYNGSSYVSDGKWLIYRDISNVVTVNGNCTGNAATATDAYRTYHGIYETGNITTIIKNLLDNGYYNGYINVGPSVTGTPTTEQWWQIEYFGPANIGNGVAIIAHKYGSSFDSYRGYFWKNSNDNPSWKKITMT